MIYVFPCGAVVYDATTISEEEKSQAVAVEELPVPEAIEGKYAQIRADKENERLDFEYSDIPPGPPEEEEYEAPPKPMTLDELQEVVADLALIVLPLEVE